MWTHNPHRIENSAEKKLELMQGHPLQKKQMNVHTRTHGYTRMHRHKTHHVYSQMRCTFWRHLPNNDVPQIPILVSTTIGCKISLRRPQSLGNKLANTCKCCPGAAVPPSPSHYSAKFPKKLVSLVSLVSRVLSPLPGDTCGKNGL